VTLQLTIRDLSAARQRASGRSEGSRGRAFWKTLRSLQDPQDGRALRDKAVVDLVAYACRGIRHVTADIPSEAPLAVAVTGHISSLTFVDADGHPLRASIGFQDQRAVAETNDLYAAFSRGDLAALLGIDLPPAPTWPLPRLLWFRKHEPATLQKARFLLQAKDFVNFRLTGSFASDPSSNRGMINSSNGQPASSVFAKLDLPYLLPPLFSPQQVIGHISAHASRETGLRCGVPVVAGWNDLNACVLGSGAVKAGQAFNVTGTSEHIGVVTTGLTAANELVCAPYLPGTRLLYGVTSSGGGSLQWFSHLSGQTIESLLNCPKSTSEELLFCLISTESALPSGIHMLPAYSSVFAPPIVEVISLARCWKASPLVCGSTSRSSSSTARSQ
jgi:sugar (pentulose or hexulose) kinase